MTTEHIIDENYKYVRFYIDHLPFEIMVEIEKNAEFIVAKRMVELEADFEKWGDYLHSDLFVDWTTKQKEVE